MTSSSHCTEITCDCGVFIPASNGIKHKNPPRDARVLVENKVAPFFQTRCILKWHKISAQFTQVLRNFATLLVIDCWENEVDCCSTFGYQVLVAGLEQFHEEPNKILWDTFVQQIAF